MLSNHYNYMHWLLFFGVFFIRHVYTAHIISAE